MTGANSDSTAGSWPLATGGGGAAGRARPPQRADETRPDRMIRTRWPSQFGQDGRVSGEGTAAVVHVVDDPGVPVLVGVVLISYDCSQPCPHFMHAKEYASWTVPADAGPGVEARGLPKVSLMAAPGALRTRCPERVFHYQRTPPAAGPQQGNPALGPLLG